MASSTQTILDSLHPVPAVVFADIKYIDPTYMIQAVPCNSLDHIYTKTQAYHAVDAAFAGYTGGTRKRLVSSWHRPKSNMCNVIVFISYLIA
jgi:hypothetical protein